MGPLGPYDIVVPCAISPSARLSVRPFRPRYRSTAHNIWRILFIFYTAIDLSRIMNSWLWGLYIRFLGFCGTWKLYEYIYWLHDVWDLPLLPLTALQPTLFNGFCSYLIQALTLVRVWILLIIKSIWLCFVALWNFTNTDWLFWVQGAVSIRKTVLPGMAIPMLKIRRPNGRLIFNMEIAIRR